MNSWETAGRIIVQLAREDKNIYQKINHDYPFISTDTLEVFHHIGTKSLYPLAVLLPRHVFSAVRNMSYQHQIEVCNNPVQVVTRMSAEKPVVIRKGVAKLTTDEVKKALGRKGNLSVEVQVRRMTAPPPIADMLPKPEKPASLNRVPKSLGLYSVRRAVGGGFAFEKTTARPYTLQKVILHTGQAVIELCEYQGE